VEVYLHKFVTSALDGEWSALRAGRFTSAERTPLGKKSHNV